MKNIPHFCLLPVATLYSCLERFKELHLRKVQGVICTHDILTRFVLTILSCNFPYSSWNRCFVKNLSIAFLVPSFFTAFYYSYSRTSYDIVSNTVVVKKSAR